MKITVTNEDIEGGQQSDPHACAVARALARAGLNHFGVMGPSVMLAEPSGHLVSSLLPTRVREWISDFEAGKLVGPFSFDLEKPDEQSQLDSGLSEPNSLVPQGKTRADCKVSPMPKSETRFPDVRKTAEIRSANNKPTGIQSNFGFRPSFGTSVFGFRPRRDFYHSL